MTFEDRLDLLIGEATGILRTLIETFGQESKNYNSPSISIEDSVGGEDFQYNLEGGRWLDEIIILHGELSLIDNQGYQYSPSVLGVEKLMKLTDYLRTPGVA